MKFTVWGLNWKRKKTGRKQGAQTGHKGHGRKKQTPTETVILPAPQEALDNPDFKKTGKTIVKQLVGIHMVLDVTEYRADVYYNSKTGERVHAPFPAEDYNGIIVQDHEKTFYKYGSDHQECLAHVERYLKDSAENENGKSWSTMMRALLKEMIHYRNGLPRGEECNKEKINEFEARYLEIINTAKKEYEDEPPGDYYKEGFNLSRIFR